jgi:hypothetical protein
LLVGHVLVVIASRVHHSVVPEVTYFRSWWLRASSSGVDWVSDDIVGVRLPAEHAVELCELLEVLGDWLWGDRVVLADSWRRFLGVDGYDVEELGADLARFAFLLGGDGERFVFGDDR